MTAGAAQVASVLPRLARSAPGRRLRIQPQVGEDRLPLTRSVLYAVLGKT